MGFSKWLSSKESACSAEVKWSEVAQSCPALCDPLDCSPPGSSIHGIFQARILEWVAMPFPRRSSQPRDWTRVSHIVGRCFTVWAVAGSIPGSGRSPGGGHGNPLHYSCLGIPWTEESGGLRSIGLHKVRHDWSDWARTHAMTKDVENLSVCLLAIYISCLEKCLFILFVQVLIGLFVFLLFSCNSFL